MLDTTEFNAVAKGQVTIFAYSGRKLFATHVQLDEIDQTRDPQSRAQLRAAFDEIAAERMPTESAVWDVSKYDEAKYSAVDGLFERMLARLKELDPKKRHPNQHRDILVAETAIKKGLILVTGDRNLQTVVAEFGGHAIARPNLTANKQGCA
jgi:hypothetical protein